MSLTLMRLRQPLKNLEQKNYNKYFLGFGFFESYFKKITEKDKTEVDDLNEQNDETQEISEIQNAEEKII